MWASPPEDTAHGPNGPRNVVYNCDVRSPKAGLWMGGMNENWLILYNRFIAGSGPGILAKTASFDHIIRGNVFCLADEKRPAVVLLSPECIGVELIGNRVLGGNAMGWPGQALRSATPPEPAGEAPRPRPSPHLQWQRQYGRARQSYDRFDGPHRRALLLARAAGSGNLCIANDRPR